MHFRNDIESDSDSDVDLKLYNVHLTDDEDATMQGPQIVPTIQRGEVSYVKTIQAVPSKIQQHEAGNPTTKEIQTKSQQNETEPKKPTLSSKDSNFTAQIHEMAPVIEEAWKIQGDPGNKILKSNDKNSKSDQITAGKNLKSTEESRPVFMENDPLSSDVKSNEKNRSTSIDTDLVVQHSALKSTQKTRSDSIEKELATDLSSVKLSAKVIEQGIITKHQDIRKEEFNFHAPVRKPTDGWRKRHNVLDQVFPLPIVSEFNTGIKNKVRALSREYISYYL